MTAFPTVAAGRNSSAAAGPATIAPVRRREGGCPHDPLFGNKLPDTVGPRGPQWTRAPEDRGANGAGVDREARRLLERPARNAYPRGRRTQRPACRSLRLFAAAMALAAGGAALAQGGPGFPPARVEVATAELRDMAPVVEVPGTVVSQNDSRIASEVEGVLTWLSDVGDAVKAGDAIARIDPRLRQVELKRVRADVARLEADLRYRERQLERTEELAASNTASATLLDESRALRDQALQLLEDAKARRERAEYDLERTTIRAAFAGHVVERLASVGEYIGVGEDVVRLVDTHRKEIALAAPIALTRFVRPESSVTVRNGATVQQHPVRTVVPVGDAVSRMVEIRLSIGDNGWLVGTPVQVSLPSDTAVTAVAVPRDALVERGGQAFVYKVSAEGTAVQVPARIQSTVGLWVGLESGVEAGDRVIIRGAERLSDGQAVEVFTGAASR